MYTQATASIRDFNMIVAPLLRSLRRPPSRCSIDSSSKLTADLVLAAIAELVANPGLTALRGPNWRDTRRADGCDRGRGDWTNCRRADRRQIERAAALRLHLAVHALADASGLRLRRHQRHADDCDDPKHLTSPVPISHRCVLDVYVPTLLFEWSLPFADDINEHSAPRHPVHADFLLLARWPSVLWQSPPIARQ